MREVTQIRKEQLINLEQTINYKFKKLYILDRALTHSSYVNQEQMQTFEHNERLEFLGDSILSFIVSEFIYNRYKKKAEGKLTKIRAEIVCENSLFEHSKRIDLGKFLLLSKNEEQNGGRERVSILADAYEALIASIFLDGGIDSAKKFILEQFEYDIKNISKSSLNKDYKSRLQEVVQKDYNSKIEYKVINEEGPAHNRIFYMKVIINNKIEATGHGKSKKEAAQEAAKNALMLLGDIK